MPVITRRYLAHSVLALSMLRTAVSRSAEGRGDKMLSIEKSGAVGDGVTVNTKAIQSLIDQLSAQGGGTILVPPGIFVSGALFFKPGVNLYLVKDAVLRCSTDMANFPRQRTRIEGHFEESFTPALINAKACDGFHISGQGVLDGAGRPIWDQFWKLYAQAKDPANFPNLSIARARLALIEDSRNVVVEGITFRDSQFWNLHLYRCQDVLVRGARFEVPDDYKQAPSSDGIDVDSSQRVTIEGCYFSVTDDCIAAKGSKGPRAMDDMDSPPVEQLHVKDCHFRRGHHALACGSEATIVRDILVENCRVTGDMVVVRLKLRPDTPQRYERIMFRDITLDNEKGSILGVEPWVQYRNLDGMAPPTSTVRGLHLIGFKGRYGALGQIVGNPGQTRISDILLKRFDIHLSDPKLKRGEIEGLKLHDVLINGKPITAVQPV